MHAKIALNLQDVLYAILMILHVPTQYFHLFFFTTCSCLNKYFTVTLKILIIIVIILAHMNCTSIQHKKSLCLQRAYNMCIQLLKFKHFPQ